MIFNIAPLRFFPHGYEVVEYFQGFGAGRGTRYPFGAGSASLKNSPSGIRAVSEMYNHFGDWVPGKQNQALIRHDAISSYDSFPF